MHRKVVNIFVYVHDLFHILLSCDRLLDPWNVCIFVCMYVCTYVCIMHVRTYTRMYLCMYVCM